jgi:hypothetical protein
MKKILAAGLAAAFLAVSGLALADGTSPACTGKKCHGHHHKGGGAKGPANTNVGPTGSTGPTK